MSTPRKLLLALCVTAATLAFTAFNASAAPGPIHFINEDTLEHCDASIGNCDVHIASVTPTTIVRVIAGVEQLISSCTDEFEATLDENPFGSAIHNQSLTGPVGVCTTRPCDQAGLTEWPIHSGLETAPNEGGLRLRFCLVSTLDGITPFPCEINVQVVEEGDHDYELRANGVPTGSHCVLGPVTEAEVFGHWVIEDNGPPFEDIEIIHEA
jgi:hypothetical protein